MSTTHNIKTKLLATAVGVAAAAVAPALLFAGAGTAQANGLSPFTTDASDCNWDNGMSGFLQCKYFPPANPANSVPTWDPPGAVPRWNPPVWTPSAVDLPYNPTLNNPNAPAPATMGPRDPADDGTYRPPTYPWFPDLHEPNGPYSPTPVPVTGPWSIFGGPVAD
jgi:hypothetical protein